MREPELQSPLHHLALASQARPMDAAIGAWANEVPLLGFMILRGNTGESAFAATAANVLGAALPCEPCTLVRSKSLKILWLAPDEWMIVAPREDLSALLSGLRDGLAGVRSQVVDNSGGYTEVVLRGRHAADVLSHTTVYDVAALGEGRVVGTTFGKTSVYLHRQDDGFCLLVRRSFADYIWRLLVRAAEPYGFGVVALGDQRSQSPSGTKAAAKSGTQR